MSSINRIPNGWLGFLGIKNFGRNPVGTTEYVGATWDLEQLYLNNAAEFLSVSTAGIVLGSTVTHTPEQNEIWYVHEFSGFLQTAAGAAVVVAPCRFGQLNTERTYLADNQVVAASLARLFQSPRCPFYLGPGEKLGFDVATVAGVVNLNMVCRFTRLQV